jgi:small subunit ribosomal protein S6
MNKYEIMFIVKSTENVEAVVNKYSDILKKNGAEDNIEVIDFSLRDLAYPIKKETKGHYFIYNVNAPSEATDELDRLMKIDQAVIRHIVINKNEDK